MSFSPAAVVFLAQNFDNQTGSGGSQGIVSFFNNLTGSVLDIAIAITALAAVLSVLRVVVVFWKGGSFLQAFSGFGLVLLCAFLLGVGTTVIVWTQELGQSLQ